jgi:hypothetical protein
MAQDVLVVIAPSRQPVGCLLEVGAHTRWRVAISHGTIKALSLSLFQRMRCGQGRSSSWLVRPSFCKTNVQNGGATKNSITDEGMPV